MDMTEKEIIENGVKNANKLLKELQKKSIFDMDNMISEYKKQAELMRNIAAGCCPGTDIYNYFKKTSEWFSEIVFCMEWSKKGLIGVENSTKKYIKTVGGTLSNEQN